MTRKSGELLGMKSRKLMYFRYGLGRNLLIYIWDVSQVSYVVRRDTDLLIEI